LPTGAAFLEPVGWVRLPPDKAKTKGPFISPDSDRNAPQAMIMIDIGEPAVASLRGMRKRRRVSGVARFSSKGHPSTEWKLFACVSRCAVLAFDQSMECPPSKLGDSI
jgi:hypothetical protein